MILIRPLIRANLARPYSAHVVIFFIILVGNVGGALSPLGDPPLFVGFLHGVDFFWTTQNIWLQTVDRFQPAARALRRNRPVALPCRAEGECAAVVSADPDPRPRQSAFDRRHHREHSGVGVVEAWNRVRHLRNQTGIAEPVARCLAAGDCRAVAVADARRASRGQWLHLGADPGSRKTVCRHLHRHHSRGRDACRRTPRRLRLVVVGGDRPERAPPRGALFLVHRV